MWVFNIFFFRVCENISHFAGWCCWLCCRCRDSANRRETTREKQSLARNFAKENFIIYASPCSERWCWDAEAFFLHRKTTSHTNLSSFHKSKLWIHRFSSSSTLPPQPHRNICVEALRLDGGFLSRSTTSGWLAVYGRECCSRDVKSISKLGLTSI